MVFGSHLYGTETPTSDLDYKGVVVPPARAILLGRVRGSVSTARPKAEREKNYAGEVEEETYSLQRYLTLLSEGQTVALDMLFAPPGALLASSELWREITANRARFLSRKSTAFVGYCRQQANKYGIKGSRVAAARATLDLLMEGEALHGPSAKLSVLHDAIRPLVERTEMMELVELEQREGVTHWDVCGRKLAYTATIKSARECIARIVEEYGHRALAAEANEGVDWKALSHAVRVGREALELLMTGAITFPLTAQGSRPGLHRRARRARPPRSCNQRRRVRRWTETQSMRSAR